MPFKVLVGLILCNLIWSAHPAMGKLVLADVSPALGAWLRYSSALLAYLLAVFLYLIFSRKKPRKSEDFFLRPQHLKDWMLVGALGGLAFCFSPFLQMTGLQVSRATDNALIVAMEPLMTVILARIFLGERISRTHVGAFAVALLGFCLLTGAAPAYVGNVLMLTALVGEASYSVLGRKLLERHSPLGVFGLALALGVLFLTIGILFLQGPQVFSEVLHLGWGSVLALLWLGPLGTALGYCYWMSVLRNAPVASLALTLFIQPVFGSLWGYFFLTDRLTGLQTSGAGLIVVAVLAQAWIGRFQASVMTVPSL